MHLWYIQIQSYIAAACLGITPSSGCRVAWGWRDAKTCRSNTRLFLYVKSAFVGIIIEQFKASQCYCLETCDRKWCSLPSVSHSVMQCHEAFVLYSMNKRGFNGMHCNCNCLTLILLVWNILWAKLIYILC